MICGKKSGHAWNVVKLDGNWYNWDMTNVKSDTLTLKTMGRCLKTDKQIANKQIYQNNNSTIECTKEPEKSLIDEINTTIKNNIKTVPRLNKENWRNRIKRNVLNRVSSFKRLILKNKTKLLPETSMNEKTEGNTDIEFTRYEPFMDLADRNSRVFQVQTWEKGNVKNRLRTSYLEVGGIEGEETSEVFNNEKFKEFYRVLLEANRTEESYIGRIDLLKNSENKMDFLGWPLDSEECIGMIEFIALEVKNRNNRRASLENNPDRNYTNTNNVKQQR